MTYMQEKCIEEMHQRMYKIEQMLLQIQKSLDQVLLKQVKEE